MHSKIKVAGNIISELSEKIPTNIIALNELIKNSYDAGAKNVTIIFNSGTKNLLIIDDGDGMDLNDIKTLFHISKSTKKYGTINKYKRYTQGSKGLGFLSVFKFGNFVTWKSFKDSGLEFSIDFKQLSKSDDLSNITIPIVENKEIKKGTIIDITLNDDDLDILKEHLLIEKNHKKIVNAFNDEDFTINLDIDGKMIASSTLSQLIETAKENRLYYISYRSLTGLIKFFFNNHEILSEKFPLLSEEFNVDLDLVVYHFPPYGKDKVDKLFLNPNNDLTPLIYVNSNLFNNYDLFNPNIMTNIKTSLVLNQMIGFVNIISSNQNVNFNSDRSQFLQNKTTEAIKIFLEGLNKKIQEIGSSHKKYLAEFDFLSIENIPNEDANIVDPEYFRKYIKNDFKFKKKVLISLEEKSIKFALFGQDKKLERPVVNSGSNGETTDGETTDGETTGGETTGGETTGGESTGGETTGGGSTGGEKNNTKKAAKIQLNSENEINRYIYDDQIDLKEFIASIYDSEGNKIDTSILKIEVDGAVNPDGILESISQQCKRVIVYSFNDKYTGFTSKSLTINFVERSAIVKGGSSKKQLIRIPTKEDYTINFNPFLSDLINQINDLQINNYKEVIACSLRAIFDISNAEIERKVKFQKIFNGISQNQTEEKVKNVIAHVSTNKNIEQISKSTGMSFKELTNILKPNDFEDIVKKGHLGAHKGSMFLSEQVIEELGIKAGIYVVIVNEMINNGNVT